MRVSHQKKRIMPNQRKRRSTNQLVTIIPCRKRRSIATKRDVEKSSELISIFPKLPATVLARCSLAEIIIHSRALPYFHPPITLCDSA